MGTVYLALRDDDTFRRRVVIKVVRADLASEAIGRRLRTESQIVAALDHPNIAKIFDGGTTAGERPYFVMEYVEGLPVDEHCERHRLGVEERLGLFRKICSAVHYAHQNLVVHRDLKPSNILVTAEGEPKLLDFGIAKLVNPELGSPDPEPTEPWIRLLTPHYASPEQVGGRPVTTSSDVYSLGVLLYRLLTGHLPHRFDTRSPGEIERILLEEAPPAPSVRVLQEAPAARTGTGRELHRQLAGDLDSIVLKALKAAPSLRYASAEQLAEDLDRYRQGLPVLARRGTWRYRWGKLVRRHRGAVAAATLAAGLLVGFAVAMAQQSAWVAEQRDEARLERDKAQTVLDLMLDIFRVSDPYQPDAAATFTVREALEQAAPLLDRRLQDQPRVRAELFHALGRVYHNLGLYPQAREHQRQAVALRRAALGPDHPALADSLGALAETLREEGEAAEAEALFQQAAEISRVHGPDHPAALVESLTGLATTYCYRRAYEEAAPVAAEALALARRLPEEAPLGPLAEALAVEAAVSYGLGHYRESARSYQEAVSLFRGLWGAEHPGLAPYLINLGLTRRRVDDFRGAEEAYRAALALQLEALGPEHPDLASTFSNLGGVERALGAPVQAEASYRRARSVLARAVEPGHWRLAFLDARIANARIDQGAASEAQGMLEAALPGWRRRHGDHWVVAFAEGVLGEALAAQGRYGEAESVLVKSFEALLGQPQQRRREEALDRLRSLYASAGTPGKLAPFHHRLTAASARPRGGT